MHQLLQYCSQLEVGIGEVARSARHLVLTFREAYQSFLPELMSVVTRLLATLHLAIPSCFFLLFFYPRQAHSYQRLRKAYPARRPIYSLNDCPAAASVVGR